MMSNLFSLLADLWSFLGGASPLSNCFVLWLAINYFLTTWKWIELESWEKWMSVGILVVLLLDYAFIAISSLLQ
jgi:hypothetical protein